MTNRCLGYKSKIQIAERQQKTARGGGAESSTSLSRQVGQKPVRGSLILPTGATARKILTQNVVQPSNGKIFPTFVSSNAL